MAAILSLTTGVVYARGWTGTLTGGIVTAGDGTAAAPAYAFASQPGFGWYRRAPSRMDLVDGSTVVMDLGAGNLNLLSTVPFGWSSGDASLAQDTALTRLSAGVVSPLATHAFGLASALLVRTAPTVTSAGTSPSITGSNGSASFRVNVGTGGTATTIVLAMPAAATGWNAMAVNLTGAAANRAAGTMVQQSSTTTSITLQYQNQATGVALAFTASDIVGVTAFAY